MSYTGNFGKYFVKQVQVRDDDNNVVDILMKYSARTPLLYLNYFGTDMFDDLAEVVINLNKREDIVKKVDEKGADKLTADDLKGLDMTLMHDFFHKFGVALVATAHYPTPLSYDVISEQMIPADFITDQRYAGIFSAIEELFIPALEDYKKKLMQIGAAGVKRRT